MAQRDSLNNGSWWHRVWIRKYEAFVFYMNTYFLNIDYKLFEFFNRWAGRSDLLDTVFVIFAEYIVFLLIAGLALFVLLQKRSSKRLVITLQALAAAFLSRAVFVSLIRLFFFRARPFVAGTVNQLIAQNPLEGSFPSGHASIMFALAFTLFFASRRWGIVYLILALLSSVARIIVGVHFPLDIVGGMLIALFGMFSAQWLFDFYFAKKRSKEQVKR